MYLIQFKDTMTLISPDASPKRFRSIANDETILFGGGKCSPVREHFPNDVAIDVKYPHLKNDEDLADSCAPPVYKKTTEEIEKSEEGWCNCDEFSNFINLLSSRQWRILVILLIGTLTSSLSVCLFPPFYPKLAEEKGESVSMYGIVIGTNCLTAFIVTPIIGKNIEKIGVNFAFLAGMFASGVCCICSGFLEYFPPGIKFKVVSIAIRVLHATANAAIITSNMAFIASEFPNSVAFLFSLTRATMNLAQMFGPIIGGALHTFGGFKMPFFVLGSVQTIVTMLCPWYLPAFIGKKSVYGTKKNLWGIFKVPGNWVAFVTFVFSTMSNGFLSITLEPLVLRKFGMNPLEVGVLFGLKDGANCFASPIWGWMADRMKRIKLIIVFGSVMGAISFMLLGPFPGIPINHTVGIVVLSLVLNGFGVGGQQVAGVISAIRDTVDAGFPDEPDTHAFITGLWSSLSGAGRFTSRAGSGFLVDYMGFQYTSAIVTFLHLFILLFTTVYLCCFSNYKTKPCVSEKEDEIENNTSEPTEVKSCAIPVPMVREDLEGSFMIGSKSSRRKSLWNY